MKSIPIILPEKKDGPPVALPFPSLSKLDKLAKVLISSGAGLALAGVISGLLNSDDEMQESESQPQGNDAQ
ncbi:MAG: hypothetical protein II943_07625 [Victivallales bacterium]|nr:hypothetical protein [Victivallales bacterium]